MSSPSPIAADPAVFYPDCDGEPMSDNTLQFRWIVTIEGGLEALFRDDANVFVAGDLLWYPVEGDNKTRTAPDAMVVFGRPKGYRGSYRQWEEDDISPQVVFEVLSPGNRAGAMSQKLAFYDRYGVEEYYIYDPEGGELKAWLRGDAGLAPVDEPIGWTSPRLDVHFDMADGDLILTGPDGKPFASYVELAEADAQKARKLAEKHQQLSAQDQRLAEQSRRIAELEARLRSQGIDPTTESSEP